MDKDLKTVEGIVVMHEQNEEGIFKEERLKLKKLEIKKRKMLKWREAEWKINVGFCVRQGS